ncbi:glycine betaine ABC transporter substrate-binding protein [Gordonia sp. (in: high G+C Gram-positive bacteria)]|uniref:glycine betaine ABC transporter substrate-binding protein n=1 Tax=Gordonia sp. (in: high G+C Gram-positive bacteria) TaxID=84139 RepID=UPI0016917EF4|nr:glycine betaine ABC transporter substrate-binding protein [Gordonia sp. (in: high G+C Gram-positive bacteria)]NLG47687.1 glycine betaine ABC transporter substrate-binding protein [Gordonia sp. (in: high G+C Gram-positive bacteria)]
MTKSVRRACAALLGACALILGVAACGLQSGGALPLPVKPGSITVQPDLEGQTITVGSKDFTEQVILGYILAFSLSAAGADVRDLTNIQGSNSTRDAMLAGQVDATIEYTGTGWINYLGNETPISDATEQFNAVRDEDLKRNDVVWVNPAPMDNTYALAMSKATAEKTGVKTLSDYAALVKSDPAAASTCLETEFRSRQDGFPGMAAKYGFDPAAAQTQILQTGIIYQATANGNCAFGEVFTTDGRIKALDLIVLEDDKQFFPHYNAAVTTPKDVADRFPSIAKVTAPVMAALTSEAITELNRQVDVDGKEPADVARDWLVSKGFVNY